jgi:hypothetical protein
VAHDGHIQQRTPQQEISDIPESPVPRDQVRDANRQASSVS